DLVAAGESGYMVAARGEGTEPVPLADVAGKVKLVPLEHDWVTAARKVGTGLGD
ncbi:MAG TPA: 6-phosphofructokinase, partial [Micrococcales bacterium]|nr:6-phosphofructokinase [Micrococcales bacterium]